jgi:hypothetical protein
VLGNQDVITNGTGRTYGSRVFIPAKLTKTFGILPTLYSKGILCGLDQYRPSVWDSRN